MISIQKVFETVAFFDPRIGNYKRQQSFGDKKRDLEKQKKDILKRFRKALKKHSTI